MDSRVASVNKEKDGKCRGQHGSETAAQHNRSHKVQNVFNLLEGIGKEEG